MRVVRPAGKTLAAVVAEKARAAPAHPAILFGERAISYGELNERVDEAAKALLALGVKRGEVVAALLGNDPDWVVAALASSAIGALFVPLNTWYKKTELAWTLRHCDAAVLVVARRYLKADYGAMIDEIVPGFALPTPALPGLRTIAFIGETPRGARSWEALLKDASAISNDALRAARASVDPDAPAYVLYTSGSTADPKGVLLNHRGVVENGFDLGQRRAIVAEDRTWLGSPLFYALGATNALPATLSAGATLVLQGHFEPGLAIAVIRRTRATVYYGTGNMSRALLDHPDYMQAKIGSLKKGNAGLLPEYRRQTLIEMGITQAVPAYGLTETYGNATVGEIDDPVEVKIATNGRKLPGMEMIIVEPSTGARLKQGETGLVLVRGYTTPGYLGNPVETAKALRPDGFFDTGDLGHFDGDDRFIFHSRLKEVIKSGGINVSPLEVEQILAGHPDVRDAHVVGVGDGVRGERIVAFVNRTGAVGESALRDYVKERAASFKVPHHILFRAEHQLPRLASGKVAKHQLIAEARRELGL